MAHVLTFAIRNDRLRDIESRLGKLQSLCQTAGLCPVRPSSSDENNVRQIHQHVTFGHLAQPNALQLHANYQHAVDHSPLSVSIPIVHSAENEDRTQSKSTRHLDDSLSVIAQTGPQGYSSDYIPPTSRGNHSLPLRHGSSEVHANQISPANPLDSSAAFVSNTMDGIGFGMDVAEDITEHTITSMGFDASSNLKGHFQILSMIFTDTSETRLLAEIHDMSPHSFSVPLPPKDVTYSVLTNFFHHFDNVLPLYEEATTFNLVELFFDPMPCPKPELAAYVYSVIALSYTCARQSTTASYEGNEAVSWTFFTHAACYLPHLMASAPTLLSIQALLGMVSLSTQLFTCADEFCTGILLNAEWSHKNSPSTDLDSP
jgi:hypothetical protein